MRRLTFSLPSLVNRGLNSGCQVTEKPSSPAACVRLLSTPLEGLFLLLFVTAPPVQDFSEPESGLTHGAATTVRPTNQSVAFTSVAVPATTVNHTTGLLSDPIIFPYPSNDHVFISKSFRSLNRILSVTVTDKRSVSCLQKKTTSWIQKSQ